MHSTVWRMFASVSSWKLGSREGIHLRRKGRKCHDEYTDHGWEMRVPSHVARGNGSIKALSLLVLPRGQMTVARSRSLWWGCPLGWCRNDGGSLPEHSLQTYAAPVGPCWWQKGLSHPNYNCHTKARKVSEPISRVSRTAGTRSLEVKKGEMIWMFAYTMDIHKVCFATTSMISDSNQVRIWSSKKAKNGSAIVREYPGTFSGVETLVPTTFSSASVNNVHHSHQQYSSTSICSYYPQPFCYIDVRVQLQDTSMSMLAEVAGSCRSSMFLLDVKDWNLTALRPDSPSPSSPWVKPLLRTVCIPNCLVTANLSEGGVEYMLELLICPEFLPSLRSLLSLRWLTSFKTPAA